METKTYRSDSTWFFHNLDPILQNNFSCRSKSTEKPILAVTNPALLGQPLLIDDSEDCNNVSKVFLIVPMGVNGHTEVRRVQKLGLEHLRFFLGRDNVYQRYIQNGRPVAQLPFLALGILQPIRRLEGGTHFSLLPESGTKQEFLERRLWRNL
jgi:hypothetical protein